MRRLRRMQTFTWLLSVLFLSSDGVNVTLLDSLDRYRDHTPSQWYLMEIDGRTLLSTCNAGSKDDPSSWITSPPIKPPSYKLFVDIKVARSGYFNKCLNNISLFLIGDNGRMLNSEKKLNGKTQTVTLVFNSYPPDVRLALVNYRGCTAITQIKIYYKICDSFVKYLAAFPSAIAPSFGVQGRCLHGFVPKTDAPSYDCNLDGQAGGFSGSCVCNFGFMYVPALSACHKCFPNYFKNWRGNTQCRKCPPNSKSLSGSSRCLCDSGMTTKMAEDGSMYCLNISLIRSYFNVTFSHASPGKVYMSLESQSSLPLNITSFKLHLSPQNAQKDPILIDRMDSPQLLKVSVSNLCPSTSYQLILLAVVEGDSKAVITATKFTIDLQVNEWVLLLMKYITLLSKGDVVMQFPQNVDSYQILRVIICPRHLSCQSREAKIHSSEIQLDGLERGQYTIKIYGTSTGRLVGSSKSWSTVIAGSVTLVFLLFLIVFLLRKKLFLRHKEAWYNYPNVLFASRKNRDDSTIRPNISQKKNYEDSDHQNVLDSLKNCIFDPKFVFLGECLAEGEKSRVYRGILKRGREEKTVAIKMILCKQSFVNEVGILSQLRHQNVVCLVGVVLREDFNLILFTFMKNQSLDQYLRMSPAPLDLLIQFLSDVSAGMEYLSRLGIIHRDLAARNVLLEENYNCRIADFGLACKLRGGASTVTIKDEKIPVKWTAPECFVDSCFTLHSDVWSFGVFSWEVMSLGGQPYFDWSNLRVIRLTSQGYRLPPPVNCPKQVYRLIEDCWLQIPEDRPSFGRISLRISEMRGRNVANEVFNRFVETGLTENSPGGFSNIDSFLSNIEVPPEIFYRNNILTVDQLMQLNDNDLASMGLDSFQRSSLMGKITNWTNEDIYWQF